MKLRLILRADAGPDIGYGHFIRTLALADMLKDDFDCCFYTTEPTEYQIRELSNICKFRSLKKESHFVDFLSCLDGNEIVVLDNYFFDTDYQRAIRDKGCKLICIDDMHDKHYVSDVVINQIVTDVGLFDVEKYTKLLLGVDFALLRAPFLAPAIEIKRNKNLLVCLGGSDPYHLADHVISALVPTEMPYHIICITGDRGSVSGTYGKNVEFVNNLNASELARLFEESACGIFSSSMVCLEALTRGLPVIAGYYVDNQIELYSYLCEKGAVIGIGSFFDVSDAMIRDSVSNVRYREPFIIDTRKVRDRFKAVFSELCERNMDYSGFTSGDYQFINYIDCSPDLLEEIRKMRNEPGIRNWMVNCGVISKKEHHRFIDYLKTADDRVYFAVLKHGRLIASINLSKVTDVCWECGMYSSPDIQGKGENVVWETLFIDHLRKAGVKCLSVKIKNENIRAMKYVPKLGYIIVGHDIDYTYFENRLNE